MSFADAIRSKVQTDGVLSRSVERGSCCVGTENFAVQALAAQSLQAAAYLLVPQRPGPQVSEAARNNLA